MSIAEGNLARRARRAFFVLTFALACAAAAAAQNASFAGRDYPAVGFKHIAADFNADGRPDLAVAGANVQVMLGNGDGTFRAVVEYPAGAQVQDLAAGDLNADGRPDLVATLLDQRTGLAVLLGNGDGTFAAAAAHPNDTGFDSPSVVLADFDHDNRLDAVVAHETNCFGSSCVMGDRLSLWRGLGDGTFQPPQQITVGDGPTRLAVADYNGDIHPDLAVSAAGGKVYVLLGLGDGTFNQSELTLVAGIDNTDVDAADFNGDSVPDIVVAADADHRTVVLLGNGDGTFRQSASILDGLQERPGEQTVADFNGDGRPDIALGMALCCTVAGDGAVGVLYGNGDGTFRAVVRYLVPGFVVSNAGGHLVAADLSGDGRPDIALQTRGNNPGLTVLTNTTARAAVPVALGGVSITPTSVVGSRQAEVNVSLARGAVAPAGSLTLSVTSSRTSVVTVPTGVRIIAGMSNVRFRVNTRSVTSAQNVSITVSLSRGGGSRASATLTVTPPPEPLSLGAVEVSPAGVFGGRDAAGTVRLAAGHVAPAGGAFVSLTNDNPALVTTPSDVLIPAGQTSANFPITTRPTSVSQQVTITGLYNGTTRSAVLLVSAPTSSAAVSSVTVSPSTVVGGSAQGVRAQVTLDQPAPSERATVALSTSHPALVGLPASLTIDTGLTSGVVDFATSAVSATTQVTISATYGGSTQSALLTLTPAPQTAPTLSALSLSPATVTGGGSSQGTVTLSAPAQAATVVSLSRTGAAAGVPASVTVPAGASSANFGVTTTSVASPTSVTISATLAGVTRTATLTVNPAATTPTDTVAIQRVEYESSKRALRVEATSTRTDATLQVFVTSTGQLLGTLSNQGGGRYGSEIGNVATNPQSITVRSSFGGSATRTVTLK